MNFAFATALKNLKRKPFRSVIMAALTMLLSLAVFAGAFTVMSLRRGLSGYRARLGADIIVVPSSAKGHGAVDDILLQGITGNYYMSGKEIDKIKSVDGVGEITTQFFLTSAKASCCSTRVQIIGFDPETDFSILPWIGESYQSTVSDGDVIAGSNINVPADRMITFYGQDYRVTAQLAETGTGLDSAVYTNMNTIRRMADSASNLLETDPFRGVNVRTAASAVLIRVADGYSIEDVADDINIHITKVQATPAKSMVSGITKGLGGVSRVIGLLVGAVWILVSVVLIAVYALVSNERRKEFAILRIMGASRKMLFRFMGAEAALIGAIGAILGLMVGVLSIVLLSDRLQSALNLPFSTPGWGSVLGLACGAFALSVCAGIVTALLSARRITKSETGLLLREDC